MEGHIGGGSHSSEAQERAGRAIESLSVFDRHRAVRGKARDSDTDVRPVEVRASDEDIHGVAERIFAGEVYEGGLGCVERGVAGGEGADDESAIAGGDVYLTHGELGPSLVHVGGAAICAQ